MLILIFIFLIWIAIGSEILYYKTTKYKYYEIEIELITGTKDTIITYQPDDFIFQINCIKTCNLQGVPKDLPYDFLGGHWLTIRGGVVNYKILN